MNIKYKNSNIILENPSDFDIRETFSCGQCFRFDESADGSWFGIACGKALKIAHSGNNVILYDTSPDDFENIWYDFFDFGTDYGKIKKSLSKDKMMKKAIGCGSGIRILRQELWESIVSFIISQSNNIPRIKGIISRLCENFGDEIYYCGKTYYTFPSAETLASLSVEDLSVIRAGFRDKYIIGAAKAFTDGKIDDARLCNLPSVDAKKELMSLKGIGNKVSDCILLFGLHRTDSYPVDVWIKRITEYCYFDSNVQSLSVISSFADDKFGELGGYAQQYLFYYARENKIGI